MRRFVLLILGAGFLTSITTPGFSEKPLRLFFEKNIDVEPQPGDEYVVKQGQWLFKILSEKGYSGAQIQDILPTIKALNPHIADLDRLMPGQVLHIPGSATATPPPAEPEKRPATPVPEGSYKKVPYVIRSGDTLVQILQAQGVPTSVIYGSYMNLFLELNPDIPNANTLRAGQEVMLPVMEQKIVPQDGTGQVQEDKPSVPAMSAGAASTGTASARAVSAGTSRTNSPAPQAPVQPPAPKPEPQSPARPLSSAATNATGTGKADERTPRTGLPVVKTILGEMRFRFMPGDESMFPLPGSGWLHVKMFETPLAETPWGGKVVFCPVPKNASWIEDANKLGMRICTVSPQWTTQEVLEKLASAFPDNFHLWGAGRDLVLPSSGISVTLQAPQMAIIENGGRKRVYMVWARQTPGESPLPQDLPEVLEDAQVKVIELDAYNDLSRLPSRPRDSIYVPTATTMELIRAINPDNPEEFFGQTLPRTLNELLQVLRDRDHLQQGMVQASWTGGQNSRIAVQVPAWTVSGTPNRVALLDKRFSDPYLVSVLSQKGYACFILPD